MRVLQVASEAAHIAKVGGLGDVLTGLTRELLSQDICPVLLLPKYGAISYDHLTRVGTKESFEHHFQGISSKAYVEQYLLQKTIPVLLLDLEEGFWSKQSAIYGGFDELGSFVRFSKACFDWLSQTNQRFDIVHVHDWQAAFLSPLLRYCWRAPHSVPKTILTLHNMEYQGKCGIDSLQAALYEIDTLCPEGLFEDPSDRCCNLLKAAILSSDGLTTVSETYAREIITPEGGKGLDQVLLKRKNSLVGIINGLDAESWDPTTDSFLSKQYGAHDSIENIRAAKMVAKRSLFEQFNIDLRYLDLPLVASVTRLVSQKGVDLLYHVITSMKEWQGASLVLGISYDPMITEKFCHADQILTSNRRGKVVLQSNESLAHQLYAACDLFLVPSLFEPCGLTQLIALRYGALPLVRRTGGLADTIVDCHFGSPESERNGFVFEHTDHHSIDSTLSRALLMYHKDQKTWEYFMMRGMKLDSSWRLPCKRYIGLYRDLLFK